MVFRDSYDEAAAHGYRDLDARQPLQRRLLDARHRARRAADPPDPQRDGRRRAAGRELQGRVQLRPARDQLPLRPRAPDRRRARDLQERRQGDRRPGGHGDHLHGQVRRARGQLVPHPPLAAARGRHARVRRRRRRCSRRFLAGQLACLHELCLLYAPNVNSYKRFAVGLVRADRDRLGRGQPHVRAARGRPRRGRRIELRLPGADVNPYLALAAHDRRRPARDRRRGSSSSPPFEGNAYESDKPHVPGTLRDARDAFAASQVAREAFGEEVVEHYLNNAADRARRRSRRPSPTGSASAASSGL